MLKKKLGINAIERDWNVIFKSYHYFKIPSTLIIPEGCKKIGNYSFCDCWWLKKVMILKSCKDIGYYAFSGCVKLKKVVIPESVDWIWDSAFKSCWRAAIILKKRESKFNVISQDAFSDCRCRYVKEETGN